MDIDELRGRFAEVFPNTPAPFLCRAPGRVNLIGEHMDYNGLPVLPMALAQELRIAFAGRSDGVINLRNVDPAFPAVSFQNAAELPPSPPGAWDNYVRASIQELNRYLDVRKLPGMDLLVSTTLPMAAGLSSSSALVVGSALAYLAILDHTLDEDCTRLELSDVLARAEHYVGTKGGAMDHTVILNADPGHACKIDFFPLKVELAPLPPGFDIILCDSMVKVEKSGAALLRFNAGPALCHLACALVERELQDEFGEPVELERLGDLWFGPLCLTSREAEDLCMRAVPEEHLRLRDIARRLGLTEGEVQARWLGRIPEPEGGFPLRARLRHQISEYRRVETGRDALLAGAPEVFGEAMNASHQSCRDDFGISSPELDALVAAARDAGAAGARLTGAGFGGATVNLVPSAAREDFIDAVTQVYYREYRGYSGTPPIFVAEPSAGAGYLS